MHKMQICLCDASLTALPKQIKASNLQNQITAEIILVPFEQTALSSFQKSD